jgi:hypothetical protein
MIIYLKLLLAHLLGDFLLQPASWVLQKEIRKIKSIRLYVHILLHGLLAQLLVFETAFIPYAILLMLVHGAIDITKLYCQKLNNRRRWFLIDQAAHLTSILLVGMYYSDHIFDAEFFNSYFWIITTGIVLLTKPASVLIRTLISYWTPENQDTTDYSLQHAGNYIGILERLFVFGFIVTGHFEAVGFLLGAKSIFRFGDLKEARDRKLTEYVLIGTLLSFGVAMLTGLAAQYVMLFAPLKFVY